ncbi:hypothetical protein V8F33_009188 [Rhypophila sp. PSN 637]
MGLLSYFFGSGEVPFTPETDIPPLAKKVILITGANSGLGKQSALEVAKHSPALIWLASRSLDKAHDAAVEIRAEVADAHIKALELDLASLDSSVPNGRLDILMLNAGIMLTPPAHLGHALLTHLLTPLLIQTAEKHVDADVRVVVLTSDGHAFAPAKGINFDTLKSDQNDMYSVDKYGQSRLANILFAREMALRNQLWAAAGAKREDLVGGEYFVPVGKVGPASKFNRDAELAGKLWDWTFKQLKPWTK